MPNENPSSSFTQSRQDVENLKQTATEAAKDLTSTAAAHVNKAKGQVQDLAGHAQDEAKDQVEIAKGKAADLAGAARDYVLARPLASIGVAFAVGFLFGVTRRSGD